MQFLTYLRLHAEIAQSLKCLRVRKMVAFYVFRKELHVLCIFEAQFCVLLRIFLAVLFCVSVMFKQFIFLCCFWGVNRKCFGSLISNSRRLFNDPICICFTVLFHVSLFYIFSCGKRENLQWIFLCKSTVFPEKFFVSFLLSSTYSSNKKKSLLRSLFKLFMTKVWIWMQKAFIFFHRENFSSIFKNKNDKKGSRIHTIFS